MQGDNLRIKDLTALLKIGRSSVYALIQKGVLPRPIKLGASSVWLKSEVEAAIEQQKAAREG